MTEPTIADIDRCIETIERTTKKWSGSADYRRFLETELFCLREVRGRLNACQETRNAIAKVREKRLAEVIEQNAELLNTMKRLAREVECCEHGTMLIDIAKAIRTAAAKAGQP